MAKSRRNHELSIEDLRRVKLTADLSDEQLIEQLRHCHGLRFEKGYEFITHLDSANDVYFIIDGRVRINVYTPGGKFLTYELVGAGELVGELAAIDAEPRSASVVAETDVTVARMSASQFRALVMTFPDVGWKVMERLAWMSRALAGRLFDNVAMNAPGRVYAEILRLCEDAEERDGALVISQAPTDKDFGSRVLATRELVTRTMTTLRKLGILERRARELWVLDIETLRRMYKDGLQD